MFEPQTTQALLLAGIAAAALFFLVSTVESLIRPGFDIRRHAISMLSLGKRGWLMALTFVVSGLLTFCFAVGVWSASGTIAGSALLAAYGIGLVVAGIFPAPAGQGFPPGTRDDMAPVMDRSAVLHSVGFMLGFGSLILASFALAIHFWLANAITAAGICALLGVAIPVLIALGVRSIMPTGIAFYLAAVLAWLVVVVTGLHMM